MNERRPSVPIETKNERKEVLEILGITPKSLSFVSLEPQESRKIAREHVVTFKLMLFMCLHAHGLGTDTNDPF